MEPWVPVVSLAMGIFAFLLCKLVDRHYFGAYVPKTYARWKFEVLHALQQYVEAHAYVAESEERLAQLIGKVPDGYDAVILHGAAAARQVAPAVLSKAEQLGLYAPGTFEAQGWPKVDLPEPEPTGIGHWVGTFKLPAQPNQPSNGHAQN